MFTNKFMSFPDLPRRTPKQGRSADTCRTIVKAARDILVNHGRAGLSTTSLEVSTGLKRSTLYNYFPNLDAIVMEAMYLEVMEAQKMDLIESPVFSKNTTLRAQVGCIVEGLIGLYQRLYQMDPEFCRTYIMYIDTWQAFAESVGEGDTQLAFVRSMLACCQDIDIGKVGELELHAAAKTLQVLTWSMLKDNHQYCASEKFRQTITEAVIGILGDALII